MSVVDTPAAPRSLPQGGPHDALQPTGQPVSSRTETQVLTTMPTTGAPAPWHAALQGTAHVTPLVEILPTAVTATATDTDTLLADTVTTAPLPSQATQRPLLTVTTVLLLLAAFSALVGTGMDMWTAHHVRSWIPAGAGYSTSFGPGWGGSLNRLSYFTAQSNLLVALSSVALVVRPNPRGRLLPFLQLVAMLDITLTCLVYVGVLAGPNLGGSFPAEVIVATILQHLVTPLLAWAAWLLADPAAVTVRSAALAALAPLLYCVLTLVRGALVDWYPYPFLDVPALGYPRVFGAVLCLSVLVALIALLMGLCQRFLRGAPRAQKQVLAQ